MRFAFPFFLVQKFSKITLCFIFLKSSFVRLNLENKKMFPCFIGPISKCKEATHRFCLMQQLQCF